MHALSISHLWPAKKPASKDRDDGDKAHAPTLSDRPQLDAATPRHAGAFASSRPPAPTGRDAALTHHLCAALDMTHRGNATDADRVLSRYEALRHLAPRFATWIRHPKRAETYLSGVPWPQTMDPVSAGVLVGLIYRARAIALAHTADGNRAAKRRFALAGAVHRGLQAVAALQPYRPVLDHVERRECRAPLPREAVNFALRTSLALTDKAIEGGTPEHAIMRAVAAEIGLYPSPGRASTKKIVAPEPLAFTPEVQESADTGHLEELQGAIISFVQYHNREETGRDMVAMVRGLVSACGTHPERLAPLPLWPDAADLHSNFLAGALLGTLQLGLFCGLKDMLGNGRRGYKAEDLAHCRYAAERVLSALAAIPTHITADRWEELGYLVRSSIDAGVGADGLRARVSAYFYSLELELAHVRQPTAAQVGLREQCNAINWRLVRYPVVTL